MPKTNPLSAFSEALAAAVAQAAPSLVRVDDGTRLTATGIAWEDGVLVATSHGTERDEDLAVVAPDGNRYPATLAGRDPDTDLAVLRADAALPPIPRTLAVPQVGQIALAVGRPGEWGLSATLGIIAGVQETQTAGQDEFVVTTDADLYPGVSGGALIDAEGRMRGLLNRIYGRGAGVALGTPLVARVVAALLAHGRVPRGYLGIRTQLVALPDTLRVTHGLAQSHGLLVIQAEPGGPADAGGLGLGDTILAMDGQLITDIDDLRTHLVAGKESIVTLLRGGEKQTRTVTVAAAPA